MNAFEKILSEIDKGIKTIEPLMKWGNQADSRESDYRPGRSQKDC